MRVIEFDHCQTRLVERGYCSTPWVRDTRETATWHREVFAFISSKPVVAPRRAKTVLTNGSVDARMRRSHKAASADTVDGFAESKLRPVLPGFHKAIKRLKRRGLSRQERGLILLSCLPTLCRHFVELARYFMNDSICAERAS
jgi:hypothetical protein